MIVKGYDIDTKDQGRALHEYVSEYGINLSHNKVTDVFKEAVKPRSCQRQVTKPEKR